MSFKGTFTKGEKGEKNLEYDDTVFYYFFISILTVIATNFYFFMERVLQIRFKNICKKLLMQRVLVKD